jgi:hypothetical protein
MISTTSTCRPVMYVVAHIYLLLMTGYCSARCGSFVLSAFFAYVDTKWFFNLVLAGKISCAAPNDGPLLKFLTEVFVATSTSKQQVPFREEIIQTDGAHISFSKYTLFLACANSPMGQWLHWNLPVCSRMKTLHTGSGFGSSSSPSIQSYISL